MTPFTLLIIAVWAGGVIDGIAHPASDWAHADRNKSYWICGMVFFSVFFVLPYLFAVRPLFRGATENPFRKS
jgi:hypothetical protein